MPVKKYTCSTCKNSYVKSFLANLDDSISLSCLLCNLRTELVLLRGQFEKEKLDRATETEALRLELYQLKEQRASPSASLPTYSEKVKGGKNAFVNNFQPVRKGAKPRRLSESDATNITTRNSFQTLQDIADDESANKDDIVLVGDSMVRNQKRHFAKRKSGRKVFSYGGCSLTGKYRLEDKIDEFARDCNSSTTFMIEVGTNDLINLKQHLTPDIVVEKYRLLLHRLRDRTKGNNNICILGLLPVITESLSDIGDRKLTNDCLKTLAYEEKVKFVDFWSEFAHPPDYYKLFDRGGLHLSQLGDAKFGELLHKVVENFPPSHHPYNQH